jgi:hypothetical protein
VIDFRQPRRAAPLLLGVFVTLSLPAHLAAADPIKFNGSITGLVTDATGVPQMGAAVLLFNRYDKLIQRTFSSERGAFEFQSILPDVYSIRVNLARFVPAVKRDILVQPGSRSVLAISLTGLLSSIELVYISAGEPAVMSDEWKWVLRSAPATRPVLRFGPGANWDPIRPRRAASAELFSNTQGVLSLTAGEGGGGAYSSIANQADLGTAFAVATSLFGVNQLRVSGNLGYSSPTGVPAAGFRTSYSRSMEGGPSPEVNVTMRQIFMPTRFGNAFLAGAQQANLPALQSMSVSAVDRRQFGNDVSVEYGSTLETVSFLDRLNYLSPFARVRLGQAETGQLSFAFSSGTVPTELLATGDSPAAELQHQISTLGLFPRVSLVGGAARVQRTNTAEIGYQQMIGGFTVGASGYRERVRNAALTTAAPAGFYPIADLLPDIASNSSVFNVGDYDRMGAVLSVSHEIVENVNATVAYGYTGALDLSPDAPVSADAVDLRSRMKTAMRHSMTARLSGITPGSGMRYIASYQWIDYSVLTPTHLSLTGRNSIEPGLNLHVRQPIPGFAGMGTGRLEASAELRNLLAQGYLPISTLDGRQLILIHSPRAVRGGLSFIF